MFISAVMNCLELDICTSVINKQLHALPYTVYKPQNRYRANGPYINGINFKVIGCSDIPLALP